MADTNNINWKRISAEGIAIIVSILLAFWIDAWWSEKQIEEEIAEDLVIVEHELAENVRLVKQSIEDMNRVVAENNTLIATLKAQKNSPSVVVPGTVIFWAIFINPTFDPSLVGIDAWIASGRLAGLESAVLRQRLASVRGKVDDVIEEQLVARDLSLREIYPLIRDEIGDIELIQDIFASGLHPRPGTSNQAIPESGTISVPNSGALRFSLQARVLWYEAAIKEMSDFRFEIEEIQSLIRAEIGGSGRE